MRAIQRPAFERLDALLQIFMPLGVVRQRFKFRDQIQHVLRAVADVFLHILRRIEHEILRQIAGHQIALPRNFAAVGRLQAGEDFQKRRLAAAVAPDQADAVAFLNAERGGVENRALVVAHGDFGGGNDGGHANLKISKTTDRVEIKLAIAWPVGASSRLNRVWRLSQLFSPPARIV